MSASFSTYLMFDENAEEAMRYYTGLFDNSYVVQDRHYADGEHQGKLLKGVFNLGDKQFICMDSPISRDFSFSPAMSIFVEFDNPDEMSDAYRALSSDGQILMKLDTYGFSQMFAWITDRWGVSWQLNYA